MINYSIHYSNDFWAIYQNKYTKPIAVKPGPLLQTTVNHKLFQNRSNDWLTNDPVNDVHICQHSTFKIILKFTMPAPLQLKYIFP